MEIHKAKWHSGNIKIWHILCFFNPTNPHPRPPLLSSPGFSTESTSAVETLLKDMSTLPDTADWADRQTDGQANGPTPLSDGPKGPGIYNWLHLIPRRLKSVSTDPRRAHITSVIWSRCLKLSSNHTFISNVAINYKTTWMWFRCGLRRQNQLQETTPKVGFLGIN